MAAVTVAAAALALAAPRAQAQACAPQQDVAALDQYCDSLPGATGDLQPTGTGRTGDPLSKTLPAHEVAQLRQMGSAARALLVLPAGAPKASGRSSPATAAARARARRIIASQPLAAPEAGDVVKSATTLASTPGDVVGGGFRWGLVVCTVGVAGVAWLRFRSSLAS